MLKSGSGHVNSDHWLSFLETKYSTVLSPKGLLGVLVIMLHVSCWVAAITTGLLAWAEMDELEKSGGATAEMKVLSYAFPVACGAVVLGVMVHHGGVHMNHRKQRCQNEFVVSPVYGALLLGTVALALMTSFTVLAFSAGFENSHLFNLAYAGSCSTCFGSMMVLAFYIESNTDRV